MVRTLSAGSTGTDVTTLQQLLNQRPPSSQPPLRTDGIFGAKTQARVMEFQSKNGLKADGIAGPLTMAKLSNSQPVQPRGKVPCGNTIPGVASQIQLIAAQFAAEFAGVRAGNQRFGITGGIPGIGFPNILPSFKPPDTQQATFITDVFGSSIDLTRVFISDKKGPTGRPFTAFIGDPTGLGFAAGFCVMNCGDEGHLQSTIVHEATHVWQSQHASNPAKYIENCLGSQALAVQLNVAEGALLQTRFPGEDFPGFFPNDAYAFVPGKPRFGDYAGEQIAFQVEKGITAIRNHVKSASPGVNAENDRSLATKRVQDVRLPNVTR
jgi:hypothetical protein